MITFIAVFIVSFCSIGILVSCSVLMHEIDEAVKDFDTQEKNR